MPEETKTEKGPPGGFKQPAMIPFNKFFAYNGRNEKLLKFFGTIGAVLAGLSMPTISIFMGEITGTFDPTNQSSNILDTMT